MSRVAGEIPSEYSSFHTITYLLSDKKITYSREFISATGQIKSS